MEYLQKAARTYGIQIGLYQTDLIRKTVVLLFLSFGYSKGMAFVNHGFIKLFIEKGKNPYKTNSPA